MSELYIPRGAQLLSEITDIPQIRLGIQGPPGYGKTHGALTFPNPIVLNYDRGLGAHKGRADVIEVPFWNGDYVDSIVKRNGLQALPNRKDSLLVWLKTDGMKLTKEQTLVPDSNTQVEVSYHAQYRLAPATSKAGRIDDFAEWRLKVEWYGELMAQFKELKCNVVYILHETLDRDKQGELNGKIKPLLTGQFADQLASHFTDYFRAHCFRKPLDDIQRDKLLKFLGVDNTILNMWISSTPKECSSFYLWQTQADELAPHCKTSTLVNAPRFVLANYSTFKQYARKQV